ncbi:Rho GTPase-activating protein 22/24/25 [Paragonimus westermani]|uniref:Rho GTPase-activating protein 22/24/25 n=1 Tax=Paragonimus westermani TaxID=34504 RepID=A0A5J4P3M8_9TREM|nr:Rho GTPase-activating protein 22/24/25 [Paragonimus westermani]
MRNALAGNLSTEKNIHPNSSVTYKGWLKKLGGKFKTWKKRYFVLEGTQLSYYTNPDDQRALGKFSLESTQIEIPNVTDAEFGGDNKGFVFIVKPDGTDDNLSGNHTQFVLSAQTAEERKYWIRAFRKVLYLKIGGALFGSHLNEVFPYTKPEHSYLPRVVYEAVEFIRANGIDCEGVFRKCGAQNMIQELADTYDVAATGPILQPNQHNVHVAAGLLKLYLRELPEPIVPFAFYERLKATGFHIADGQDLTVLIRTLEMLPAPNYHVLQFMCQFLFEVSNYAQSNLMTIENLASVFAPNVLRLADGDLDVEMAASPIINLTMAEFIRCHSRLFRLEMVPLNSMDNIVFGSVKSESQRSTMPSKDWQANLFSPNDVSSRSQGFFTNLSKPLHIAEKYSNTVPRPPPFHFTNDVSQTFPHSGKSLSEKRESHRNKPTNNLPVCMEPPEAYLLANVSAILDPDDEVRYWHAVAVSARAEAAGHRAHVATLSEELNRTKCDLDMAELEIGLLRQQLSHVQSSLKGLGYRAQPPTINTLHKTRGHPFASDLHHDSFDFLWNWSR